MSGSEVYVRRRANLVIFFGLLALLFAVVDVVFFVWLTHHMFSFWSALLGSCAGGFAIGVGWRMRRVP